MTTTRVPEHFDVYMIYGAFNGSEQLKNKIIKEKINLAEEADKEERHQQNILTDMHHQIYKESERGAFKKTIIQSRKLPSSELMERSVKERRSYDALVEEAKAREVKVQWNQVRLFGKTIIPLSYVKIHVSDSTDKNYQQVFYHFDDFDEFIKNGCQLTQRTFKEILDKIEVTEVSRPQRGCSAM